jgi:hypothetical protein
MCGGTVTGDADAARSLVTLLEGYCGNTNLTSKDLRRLIRENWTIIKVLAHQIHDEETSRETVRRQSAKNIAELDAEGIMRITEGKGTSEIKHSFRIITEAMEKA